MPDNFVAETEQVAFITHDVPPGIDFSNDPQLQGRNHSCLDTQLKRLGGPNFTHLPINALFPTITVRRGFFISQTEPEQRHIAKALTFELSKCEIPAIREGMIAHLLNIDKGLAETVAEKLGIVTLPDPAPAAMPTRQELPASDALSILKNGPESFAGRKLGILVSDGCDIELLVALQMAVDREGATCEIIAPKVGGVLTSDGTHVPAHHMIDGGPSMLFDAVALVLSGEGTEMIAREATARDFVADAFAPCKFIGYSPQALPWMAKAQIDPEADEGLIALEDKAAAKGFIASCRQLRLWARETAVKL